MTRLTDADITTVADRLDAYDAALVRKTGRVLMGVACHAAGIEESVAAAGLEALKVVAVPLTCGGGVIGRFSETVGRIAAHLGCRAWAVPSADAAGLAEAVVGRPDVVMMADDECFIAADLLHGTVVDNAEATGRGFAAGLALMAGGVKDRTVAVIGCGPVGQSAAAALVGWGARVRLFDIDARRSRKAVAAIGGSGLGTVAALTSLDQALEGCRLFVEASPAPATIPASCITADTFIAAPGMPLGVEVGGAAGFDQRLLHDPLQIGVATMLAMTAKARWQWRRKQSSGKA